MMHTASHTTRHANDVLREDFFIIDNSVVIADSIMVLTWTVDYSLFGNIFLVVANERFCCPHILLEIVPFLRCP